MSYKTQYSRGLKISEITECERPRERLIRCGASSLTNTELIAIIISSGTKDESAIDIAERVLNYENGNLAFLLSCQPEEFTKIKGIGPATACKLSAAFELANRASLFSGKKVSLLNPSSVYEYCSDLRHAHKEVFRILLLNTKSELIYSEDVSIGGISSSTAAPREVFANAIRKGAFAVIFVHNHPSGDPTPSKADISTTKQLIDAGNLLGIKVLDHLIVGDGRYISFSKEGILF